MRCWLLPEYIEDILPPEAEKIERLRRLLLEHFHSHGYQLVQPPMLEYVESLLTGGGRDLDLRMFKVVDQLSGKLLGLRPDITQQVARIDAHVLNGTAIARLCYAGSVLHTLPAGLQQTREVLQVGAELYGHAGIESDREVLRLLLSSLHTAGIAAAHLDLGHVGVLRGLLHMTQLSPEQESDLFIALQNKDRTAVCEAVDTIDEPWRSALLQLLELYGDAETVLARARQYLPPIPSIEKALHDLTNLSKVAAAQVAHLQVDLAELRGYHYHTGAVFAAYIPDLAYAVAVGGRYDDIGKAFGRTRPATGFTLDLRALAGCVVQKTQMKAIIAPDDDDLFLQQKISELRRSGECVVTALPDCLMLGCDRRLVLRQGQWLIEAL